MNSSVSHHLVTATNVCTVNSKTRVHVRMPKRRKPPPQVERNEYASEWTDRTVWRGDHRVYSTLSQRGTVEVHRRRLRRGGGDGSGDGDGGGDDDGGRRRGGRKYGRGSIGGGDDDGGE
jgi:hypothetical protein